ncbi:MAG: cyclic nucleotide-binding domain-containing protein [Anaerolineaceae bacterium]
MLPKLDALIALKRIFPFSLLDDVALHALLPLVKFTDVSKGDRIYSAGDMPDYLYFLLSGEVKLLQPDVDDPGKILSTGDHFGSEVLSSTDYRSTDALCTTPARLVRLDRKTLDALSRQNPKIDHALKLIRQTEKLWDRLHLPWLGENEKVLLVSRRHPFFLLLRIILAGGSAMIVSAILLSLAISPAATSTGLLMLALFILLLGVFLSTWAGLEWTNDYFFLTAERVLVQKKMVGFFDTRQESPYSAILSTGLETSVWERLLGFGSIHLRSYTGDLTFKHLPYPDVIYELLERQRHRAVRENRQQDQEEIRETLQNRLEGKTPPQGKQKKSSPAGITTTYASGSILDALARFYGLRNVKSGVVTYRTHWWILIRKTLFPSLILIVVLVFLIFKWTGLTPSLTDAQAYGGAILVTLGAWGWWLYQYFDWHNDVYIVTSDQLVDVNRKPLGKEERRSAPVKNIQTVQFKRKGIIGLVLNYGTVRIQIGNEELTFDNVYDPASIQAEIFAIFKQFNQQSQKLEQEKLAEWIKTYDELRKSGHESSGSVGKNG